MRKEWKIYQGTRIHGFDLYELQVDQDGGIMCLENDDPENLANCSVWVDPPLAVINTRSQVVYEHARDAILRQFQDVVRVKPMS